MAERTIRVDGLRELRAALTAVDESLVDIIEVANRKAADLVAERARSKAATLGRREARAAATLRTGKSSKAATLRLGNNATPGALGAEFGAYHDQLRNTHRGVMRGWNQFRVWRGSSTDAGYFLWPTIRDQRTEILAAHTAELDRLLRRYFPGGLSSGAAATAG